MRSYADNATLGLIAKWRKAFPAEGFEYLLGNNLQNVVSIKMSDYKGRDISLISQKTEERFVFSREVSSCLALG